MTTSQPQRGRSLIKSSILCLSFCHHTSGPVNLEANQKPQEGCTCVAHQAPPRGRCADYQTGCTELSQAKPCCFFIYSTCVEHLLDDHGHLALQHGVEQLDDEDEAGAEDEQRQSQENETHRHVWQLNIDEDVFACNAQSKWWLAFKCLLRPRS